MNSCEVFNKEININAGAINNNEVDGNDIIIFAECMWVNAISPSPSSTFSEGEEIIDTSEIDEARNHAMMLLGIAEKASNVTQSMRSNSFTPQRADSANKAASKVPPSLVRTKQTSVGKLNKRGSTTRRNKESNPWKRTMINVNKNEVGSLDLNETKLSSSANESLSSKIIDKLSLNNVAAECSDRVLEASCCHVTQPIVAVSSNQIPRMLDPMSRNIKSTEMEDIRSRARELLNSTITNRSQRLITEPTTNRVMSSATIAINIENGIMIEGSKENAMRELHNSENPSFAAQCPINNATNKKLLSLDSGFLNAFHLSWCCCSFSFFRTRT